MANPFLARTIRGAGAFGTGQLVCVRENSREFKVVIILLGGMLRLEGFISADAAVDVGNFLLGDMTKAKRPGIQASSDPRREEVTAVGHKPPGVTHSHPRDIGKPPKPVPDDEGGFD